MAERSTVEGAVQSLIFQNEDNGYTVLSLLTNDGELVTVVGCIPCAAPGERMTVTGVWTTHPSYGPQFAAESVERRMPQTEEDIAAYLASGILKGIGPATARRLVDRFGADTLAVIEEEPERLQTVKGITAKKAMELSAAFRELTGLKRVMEFLARYELPVPLAMQLYRAYGAQALPRLKEDPYLLTGQAYGVAFSTMDEIALSMGFDGDSPCRVEAALTYELSHNLNNGHVFLPRDKLLFASAQLIGGNPDALETALDGLLARGVIVQEPVAGVQACYLQRLYQAETQVARRLLSLRDAPRQTGKNVDKIIAEMEARQGIAHAPQQRRAAALAARSGVLLLTGGPGTGKTTSTRGIVTLLERMGLTVLLLAPTGRAAKRMSELCSREAQTIHRCLGMTFNELTGEVTFKKNEKDLLEADAVIVDEMSMVDISLMHALLKAVAVGTRLILVGDVNQLPSVGPGSVLRDIIRSHECNVVMLTKIFRQASTSDIIVNAHKINQGEEVTLDNKSMDFFFLKRYDADVIISVVLQLIKQKLPKFVDATSYDIQVLTPMRKGLLGVERLNGILQRYLNPPSPQKREKEHGDILFREGDKIMQTRNNYQLEWEIRTKYGLSVDKGTGVFNGDMGIVREINDFAETMTVEFDEGRMVEYPYKLLDELELAYAITIHKSQGSEYPAVVIPLLSGPSMLMNRNLLYTAVTRARRLLILIGSQNVIYQMVDNNRRMNRYTCLRDMLEQQKPTQTLPISQSDEPDGEIKDTQKQEESL